MMIIGFFSSHSKLAQIEVSSKIDFSNIGPSFNENKLSLRLEKDKINCILFRKEGEIKIENL